MWNAISMTRYLHTMSYPAVHACSVRCSMSSPRRYGLRYQAMRGPMNTHLSMGCLACRTGHPRHWTRRSPRVFTHAVARLLCADKLFMHPVREIVKTFDSQPLADKVYSSSHFLNGERSAKLQVALLIHRNEPSLFSKIYNC